MAKHLLSHRAVPTAKPKAKAYRLFDGDGLALRVSPTGAKSWQLRYRLDDTDQTATLGKLDKMSLAAARIKAEAQGKLAAEGKHLTVKQNSSPQRKAAVVCACS